MKKISRDSSSSSPNGVLGGSSKLAPGESKIDVIRHVLTFLKEHGFESARKELERESGVKSMTESSSTDKSGYLLSAITVYREFLNSKDDSRQDVKASEERKLEEELVNPKGGPLKPVSKPRISQARHTSNIIDVRFCEREEFQNIVSSVDVRGNIKMTEISTGKSRVCLSGGMSTFKAPVLSMDFNPKNNLLAVGCMNGGHYVLDVELPDCSKSDLFTEERDVLEISPTIISKFSKHGKYVNRVRWNSKGTLLATCSYDQEVRLYSVDEKKYQEQHQQQEEKQEEEEKGGGEKGKEKEEDVEGCCCLLERFPFRRGVECVEWGNNHQSILIYHIYVVCIL